MKFFLNIFLIMVKRMHFRSFSCDYICIQYRINCLQRETFKQISLTDTFLPLHPDSEEKNQNISLALRISCCPSSSTIPHLILLCESCVFQCGKLNQLETQECVEIELGLQSRHVLCTCMREREREEKLQCFSFLVMVFATHFNHEK